MVRSHAADPGHRHSLGRDPDGRRTRPDHTARDQLTDDLQHAEGHGRRITTIRRPCLSHDEIASAATTEPFPGLAETDGPVAPRPPPSARWSYHMGTSHAQDHRLPPPRRNLTTPSPEDPPAKSPVKVRQPQR